MCGSRHTALADLARDHQIVVAHGNGPQVGLLALQGAAYDPAKPWPLDVLGAETEGMIGYLIEQELMNALPEGARCATLLSRVEVDPQDPAFDDAEQAHRSRLFGKGRGCTGGQRSWLDHGDRGHGRACAAWCRRPARSASWGWRRSRCCWMPGTLRHLCRGWRDSRRCATRSGQMEGVEAVIDKDRTTALLALGLEADALLLLTDVAAVFMDFGGPEQRAIGKTTPAGAGRA